MGHMCWPTSATYGGCNRGRGERNRYGPRRRMRGARVGKIDTASRQAPTQLAGTSQGETDE